MAKDSGPPQLGDRVKAKITGIVGIVVSKSRHIHGCDTVCVQPEGLKDGKQAEPLWTDEAAWNVVKRAVVTPAPRAQYPHDGGPAARQPSRSHE